MSFKSSFGALEDNGDSWLGFGILILIWILSLVFGTPICRISALYLYFEDAKKMCVFKILILDFGWCWRFLTRVWNLDIALDMVNGLWHTQDPNFGSLSGFWRCNKHPCPLSPHLGLWRMLEVPDWGLASWSWFEHGHWFLTHPWSKFWLSILIWRCEEYPCPLNPDFWFWRMLEIPDWGLLSWSWFGCGPLD